jgi:hypothetical protein
MVGGRAAPQLIQLIEAPLHLRASNAITQRTALPRPLLGAFVGATLGFVDSGVDLEQHDRGAAGVCDAGERRTTTGGSCGAGSTWGANGESGQPQPLA